MPIDDIKRTEAVKPYMGNKRDQKGSQHKGGTGYYEDRYDAPRKTEAHDVTSFMNIPQHEITPAVTDAIISLMEEIDHLRDELAMTHSLEDILSNSVDNHMDLPVLTRHALVRELTVMVGHVARSGSASSFVYFQVQNLNFLKNRFGLLAAETAIRETAGILKAHLRETDRIGTLGGDGFGIILALSDEAKSLEKITSLKNLAEQGPILFNGQVLDLEIAYGLHEIQAGEQALDILDKTDQYLRHRFVTL